MKEFTKMDWFFAGCVAVCLSTYLYTCVTGKPNEQIKDMMQYFGLGLGLGAGSRFYGNLNSAATNKDIDNQVKLQ